MLGAILGACAGYDALPAGPVETIRRVNSLDLEPLVDRLLKLRAEAS
jgi:ADP-ribosylglycohydrolase